MADPTLRDRLQTIKDNAERALALLPEDGVLVKAGENLQAALDRGGIVRFEDGATYPQSLILDKSGTRLIAPLSSVVGGIGLPAIYFPPGARDVEVILGNATTPYDQAVVQVGTNDNVAQSKLADVPHHIKLSITVPRHRGKRAFAINGSDVELNECSCRDVYDPAGRDSQGILILNTPGRVTVNRGTFQAGSENILVGGDVTAITDVVPSDLMFDGVTLTRPASWKTDGVKRGVKNLFELKAGRRVVLRKATLAGCWVSGQSGFAIMLTPRNGKEVRDLTFESLTVDNVGSFMNILGYDDSAPSPLLQNVLIDRCDVQAILGSGYGDGRFVQWQGGPANIVITNNVFNGGGTAVYANPGTTWAAGVKGTSSVTTGVRIEDNDLTMAPYGIMLNGHAWAADWKTAFPDGQIERNTLRNAGTAAMAALKANLPASNKFA